MAAGVLDRVPVDEISKRAEQIRFGRFVLAVLGGLLMGVGYGSARVFVVWWKSATWVAASVMVGWSRAHGPSKSQQIAQLRATVEAQAMRLSRFDG